MVYLVFNLHFYPLTTTGTQTTNGTIFNPTFPGTCPYVTSVGATMVKPGASVLEAQPEMACMDVIYSGGGFSNYFAMPSYQKTAVDYYLENYPPDYPKNIWNSTGMVSVSESDKFNQVKSIISLVLCLTFLPMEL